MILAGQCHSRESYFRRQRASKALFKDKIKVDSLLKEGAHCFEKKQKVLLGKGFKKRLIKP